jgi:3-oxoacyl-[acyl-carrier protein] reductase
MNDKIPGVLVTGASRGIGRGIALSLAEEGFSVAINYARNREAAEETALLCKERSGLKDQVFSIVQGDISRKEDRETMVAETHANLGSLDALVNNAGIAPKVRADITEATEESFEEVLKTNLQGPYFLTQAVVNRWLISGIESRIASGYKIVFVTSISAETASIGRGEYCLSKAGLAMAVKLWAVRTAKEGIQVYEVRPGITATDMTSGVKEKYDRLIEEGLVPQKRWGIPEDIGEGVSSLLKGNFPFSTGTVFSVDGGFHISRL